MAAKLGTADVSFRLGATTPAAVYLGAVQVWTAATVPGAPFVFSALPVNPSEALIDWNPPESDGGSAILSYNIYLNGSPATVLSTPGPTSRVIEASAGDVGSVTAVNAIGEGPPGIFNI